MSVPKQPNLPTFLISLSYNTPVLKTFLKCHSCVKIMTEKSLNTEDEVELVDSISMSGVGAQGDPCTTTIF
jgi:hypothetical protein